MANEPFSGFLTGRPRGKAHGARLQILLYGLVATLVLSPMLQKHEVGRFVLAFVFSLVLVDAVFTVGSRRAVGVVALLLAIPLVFEFWTNQLHDEVLGVSHFGITVGIPFFLLVTHQVLQFVFQRGPVTAQRLVAAACAYLLIGYTFAGVFGAVEYFQPGSFDHRELAPGEPTVDWVDFVYYSFVTLTTLGYGDISPVKPTARAFAVLEAIIGILYMAFIIASLVGGYRPTENEEEPQ